MRPPAGRVAFVADAPVHVAHQLVDQRQAEAMAVLLARDEGLEDVLAHRRIDAGAVVADLDLDRKLYRTTEANGVHHQPADEARPDGDLGRRAFAAGVAGVGEEIDQDLHQRAFVRQHRRKRRIEFLAQCHVEALGRLERLARAADRGVEIERRDRLRLLAPEPLHAVDQGRDPVDLVGDEIGQRLVLVAELARDELRRAADRRQRILDLVREHCRAAYDGAALLVRRTLALPRIRQCDDTPARVARDRRYGQIDESGAPFDFDRQPARDDLFLLAREALGHALFGERHQVEKFTAEETARAAPDQVFGGGIHLRDGEVGRQQEQGERQAGDLLPRIGNGGVAHAACRRRNGL